MINKTEKPHVRYSHFRDGNWGLTIARTFDKETKTVKFGWAANVPPRRLVGFDEKGNKKIVRVKGDNFCRSSGRAIALGRLESRPIVTKAQGDDLPIVAVLEHIEQSDLFPHKVRYLAALALDEQVHCMTYQHLMLTRKQIEKNSKKVPNSFLDKMMRLFRGA